MKPSPFCTLLTSQDHKKNSYDFLTCEMFEIKFHTSSKPLHVLHQSTMLCGVLYLFTNSRPFPSPNTSSQTSLAASLFPSNLSFGALCILSPHQINQREQHEIETQ